MQNQITISTTVNRNIKTVWESFNQPEHIKQWGFASEDWECPAAENNLSVGGKFAYTMSAKDGSASFVFGGVYTEVELYKSIKYTMDDGREVSIVFEDLGDSVKIVEEFEPESQNPREMQQAGWQAILDNFKKHTEGI